MPHSQTSPLTSATLRLEEATPLDAAVRVGDRVSATVAGDPARRALLQGAWLGHALHPLVVEVPMGTWMSAAALDVLGGDGSKDAATLLTGLGLAAAVPAALTGWSEYGEAGPRGKRVAVVHAGANGAGAALQLASLAARRSGRHRLGSALGLTALGVVGAAGYLGGHLAVGRKVGSHDAVLGAENEPARLA